MFVTGCSDKKKAASESAERTAVQLVALDWLVAFQGAEGPKMCATLTSQFQARLMQTISEIAPDVRGHRCDTRVVAFYETLALDQQPPAADEAQQIAEAKVTINGDTATARSPHDREWRFRRTPSGWKIDDAPMLPAAASSAEPS
jgi:hypothetical protein